MFKKRRWIVVGLLFIFAFFLTACKVDEDPDIKDPNGDNGLVDDDNDKDKDKDDDEKLTDQEVVLNVIEFLKEELPKKTRTDFAIPIYEEVKGVEVELGARTSTIEDGVWKYDNKEYDYKEFLDFTISYGYYKTAFVYNFIVLGTETEGDISDFDRFDDADAELKNWVKQFADGVTKDLELPEEAGGLELTWYTNNSNVITNEGKFTRPNDDTRVRLTAMYAGGRASASTTLNITAIGFTQEEKIQHLIEEDILSEFYGKSGSSSLTFPSRASRFNFSLQWKSSHPDILSDTGEYNFPDEETEITITVTVRYKMSLVDSADPSKGYKANDEFGFEEIIEVPYTVEMPDRLSLALHLASKEYFEHLPEHFYYGKVDGDKILNLPTTLEDEEFADITITWKGEEGIFEYDEEEGSLELKVQPFLYRQSTITMSVSDGEETKHASKLVNVGFLGEDDIGISVVSDVDEFFDIERYNKTNGFGNKFDDGENIGWDFTFGGTIFKSRFKWYHSDPEADPDANYTETDFYFFFRNGAFVNVNESHIEEEGEGDDLVYRVKGASGKHSGSHLKGVYNNTDKDVVISANKLNDTFGFVEHNLYMLVIYDAEGNQTLLHSGAKLADVEAGTPDFEYVIPAGGYFIERGYIGPAAQNAFFPLATKVEIIKLRRHSAYGG